MSEESRSKTGGQDEAARGAANVETATPTDMPAAPRPAEVAMIETPQRDADVIAPRITIDSFCVSAAFATSMQTAAHDRRMAKPKTSVSMGGVGAAMKRYAEAETPHLIIVETNESGYGIFSELERLAEVCSPDTGVVVAGPSNDVGLYRELIRQGVCEYLVTPSSPLQIIEAITSVFSSPEDAPPAHSAGVYGVRGGVGASIIAHNLAIALSERTEKDTVLLDLDMEFGTAALDFNIEAKHTVADAVLDIEHLDDVKVQRLLYKYSEQLSILPSPADLRDRAALTDETILMLLDVLRKSCDWLVVDTPHSWSPAVACAMRQVEMLVLVATPDLACLRNLKTVVEWAREARPQDAAPKIVLNQVGAPKRPEISEREFKEIVGVGVDVSIAFEPAVFGAAQNDGKLLRDVGGGQKIAPKIDALIDGLIGRDAKAASTGKSAGALGMLSGLFGKS